MAEEQIDTSKGQPEAPEEKGKVIFSDEQQAKLDEIISKRIAERDAKHQRDIDELTKKHQREMELSKMDEETRHKAEEEERIKAITARAETAEHQLRVARASEMLAKVGLDTALAETLMGADDETTTANINVVVKASKALADRMYAERVGSPGAPRAPTGSSEGSAELEARMRKAANLPPKGGQ